jgi:hypothetical protein
MGRVNLFHIAIPLVTVTFFFGMHDAVLAQNSVYGCAKDEVVELVPGKCRLCSQPLSVVHEGFISDKNNKSMIDTLSSDEKAAMGVRNDNKFLVVIYKSASGDASFAPAVDKNGKPYEKKIIELKYDCGDCLASKDLTGKCALLGDTAEEMKKETEKVLKARMDKEIEELQGTFNEQLSKQGLTEAEVSGLWDKQQAKVQQKYNYDPRTGVFARLISNEELDKLPKGIDQDVENEALMRASIRKEIEGSWAIFYKNQKKLGRSDADIQSVWEDEKLKIYQKYNYDPETDSFAVIEAPQTGGDQ